MLLIPMGICTKLERTQTSFGMQERSIDQKRTNGDLSMLSQFELRSLGLWVMEVSQMLKEPLWHHWSRSFVQNTKSLKTRSWDTRTFHDTEANGMYQTHFGHDSTNHLMSTENLYFLQLQLCQRADTQKSWKTSWKRQALSQCFQLMMVTNHAQSRKQENSLRLDWQDFSKGSQKNNRHLLFSIGNHSHAGWFFCFQYLLIVLYGRQVFL